MAACNLEFQTSSSLKYSCDLENLEAASFRLLSRPLPEEKKQNNLNGRGNISEFEISEDLTETSSRTV